MVPASTGVHTGGQNGASHRRAARSAPFAAHLHGQLRDRIICGALPPGTRLSEQDIADQYELSRQPVREAFIRLAAQGLLEVRPQRGTFVTPIDMEWVLSTRFIRESVEADIARLAAARAGPADHQHLFDQIAAQEAAPDAATLARLDEQFHASLAAMAGKAMVWDHLQQIKIHLDRARHLLTAMASATLMIAQHRALAEAVAAGDAARAETTIRQHLRRVLSDLPEAVRLSPHSFIRAERLDEWLAQG